MFIPRMTIAETYYVTTDGNDSHAGSQVAPWLTVGKCASTIVAGDTCIVGTGTYDEQISPTNSGSAVSPITYMTTAGAVIRGFYISDTDEYIRIIGFTITHNDNDTDYGIDIGSCDHCEILNNTITYIKSTAIRNYNATASNCIIRGNTISYAGCPYEVSGKCSGAGGIVLYGNYNLIEYNTISHTYDFINTFGTRNIVRNNYLHSFANSDFPDYSGYAVHVDTFQPGQVVAYPTWRCVWENNYAANNVETNSHWFQTRNTTGAADGEYLIRGNVAAHFGSYFQGFETTGYTRTYNNTFVDSTGNAYATNYSEAEGNSTNNHNFSNLYYSATTEAKGIIYVEGGSSVTASNNACYLSGTVPHASCSVTDDPLFTSYATDDLTIQSGSPVRSAGKAITLVNNANGSGTSFVVDDAGFFTDGNGTITGDRIKVGSGDAVTITRINYDNNTITVDSSISWEDDDPVYLSFQTATPDIGAYPYKAGGYTLTGTYSLSGGVATVTPSDSDLVRFVEVWEDGVLIGSDSTSPFTVSGIGSGTLSVKMYSMFASKTPVVEAGLQGQVTGSFGGNLR